MRPDSDYARIIDNILDEVEDLCKKLCDLGTEYYLVTVSKDRPASFRGSLKGKQYVSAQSELVPSFYSYCFSNVPPIISSPQSQSHDGEGQNEGKVEGHESHKEPEPLQPLPVVKTSDDTTFSLPEAFTALMNTFVHADLKGSHATSAHPLDHLVNPAKNNSDDSQAPTIDLPEKDLLSMTSSTIAPNQEFQIPTSSVVAQHSPAPVVSSSLIQLPLTPGVTWSSSEPMMTSEYSQPSDVDTALALLEVQQNSKITFDQQGQLPVQQEVSTGNPQVLVGTEESDDKDKPGSASEGMMEGGVKATPENLVLTKDPVKSPRQSGTRKPRQTRSSKTEFAEATSPAKLKLRSSQPAGNAPTLNSNNNKREKMSKDKGDYKPKTPGIAKCETKLEKRTSNTRDPHIVCSFCGQRFKTRSSCSKHEIKKHGEETKQCEFCPARVLVREQRKHVQEVHDNHERNQSVFQCPVCHKIFLSRSNLNRHEKKHFEQNTVDTEQQDGNVSYSEGSRSKEETISCPRCGSLFEDQDTMDKHACDADRSPGSVECSVCKQVCDSEESLMAHSLTHSVVKAHTCDLCGKAFKEKCNMTKHKRFVHSQVRNYICSVCGKTFKQADSLKTHTLTHEEDMTFKVQCDECGKYLSGTSALLVHKRSHTGARPFMCEVCGMRFRQSGNMFKHMRKHDNQKEYKCEMCDKSYKYQDTWRAHMRRHAIVEGKVNPRESIRTQYGKVYTCNLCGKILSTSTQHKIHLRTHTNERPYQCPRCDKAFKEKGKLGRHMNNVHSRDSDSNLQVLHATAVQKGTVDTELSVLTDMQPVQKSILVPQTDEGTTVAVTMARQETLSYVQTSDTNEVIKVFYPQSSSEPVFYYNI